jgi:hypothetical protein
METGILMEEMQSSGMGLALQLWSKTSIWRTCGVYLQNFSGDVELVSRKHHGFPAQKTESTQQGQYWLERTDLSVSEQSVVPGIYSVPTILLSAIRDAGENGTLLEADLTELLRT